MTTIESFSWEHFGRSLRAGLSVPMAIDTENFNSDKNVIPQSFINFFLVSVISVFTAISSPIPIATG
jgi:hypothetical protein